VAAQTVAPAGLIKPVFRLLKVAAMRFRAAGVDGENPRDVVDFSICILCDLVLVFSQNNDRELMNALKIRMQHPSAKNLIVFALKSGDDLVKSRAGFFARLLEL
jgi:hypothetical protein